MAERELEQFANDIKRHVDEKSAETQRHFEVVAEDIKSEVQAVAEQVVQNSEDITAIREKLEEHDQKFESIETTLAVMKLDLEFIKNELKQKVNRDEFAVLEKRLSMLETRFNQSR